MQKIKTQKPKPYTIKMPADLLVGEVEGEQYHRRPMTAEDVWTMMHELQQKFDERDKRSGEEWQKLRQETRKTQKMFQETKMMFQETDKKIEKVTLRETLVFLVPLWLKRTFRSETKIVCEKYKAAKQMILQYDGIRSRIKMAIRA